MSELVLLGRGNFQPTRIIILQSPPVITNQDWFNYRRWLKLYFRMKVINNVRVMIEARETGVQ